MPAGIIFNASRSLVAHEKPLIVGSDDPISIQLTLKIFVCEMEFVGVHTIQFLHPIISWRARNTLTNLVLRISCLLHRS